MTLENIKEYLKIDYDEEDNFLNELLVESDLYIKSCVGEEYLKYEDLKKLADIVQRKLIYTLYTDRSLIITDRVKRDIVVTTIFDKLALASCREGESNE